MKYIQLGLDDTPDLPREPDVSGSELYKVYFNVKSSLNKVRYRLKV